MAKAFLIDVSKCSGCYSCQVSCKDEFCGQPWLPYSEAQPLTGSFWCKVNEKERGQTPVVTVSYTPVICGHCAECAVEKVAPDAVHRREDGLVIIDPAKAKGRHDLVDACPLGAVYWNEQLELPQKCTGCAHLLDDGWTVPRCVDSCAHEAILFGEESELDLEGAAPLPQVADRGSRVYYKNLPKRFAAGCIYDAEVNDIIEGAQVTLLDAEGAALAQTTSDFMGDWKFDQIEPAAYQVRIEANGYEPLLIEVDVTDIDRFTGDRAMRFVGDPAQRERKHAPLDPPRSLHNKVRKPVVVEEEEDDEFVHLTIGTKIRELLKYDEAMAIVEKYYPPAKDRDEMAKVGAQTLRQLHNAHADVIPIEALDEMSEQLQALKIKKEMVISADLPIVQLAAREDAAAIVEEFFPGFLSNEEVMSQVGTQSFTLLATMMPEAFDGEAIKQMDAKLRELK